MYHFFVTIFEAAFAPVQEGRAHVSCLHPCLKSTTCKRLGNLIPVAVVTQISDPELLCPFPFHASSKNRAQSLSVNHNLIPSMVYQQD